MTTPLWALSIAYWLHMLATVLWIGGLAALGLIVLPAARKTLEAPAYADFLVGLQKRLDPLGWFSVIVLLASLYVDASAPAVKSQDTLVALYLQLCAAHAKREHSVCCNSGQRAVGKADRHRIHDIHL